VRAIGHADRTRASRARHLQIMRRIADHHGALGATFNSSASSSSIAG
jgi:hypothetical protein